MNSATIVQKLWNYCNVLRDDGLIRKHQPVSRVDIDKLLLDKLPEVLSEAQKRNRIHNLLRQLAAAAGFRDGYCQVMGTINRNSSNHAGSKRCLVRNVMICWNDLIDRYGEIAAS